MKKDNKIRYFCKECKSEFVIEQTKEILFCPICICHGHKYKLIKR